MERNEKKQRSRRPNIVAQGSVTWVVVWFVASLAHGCGHYGVDLDGVVDASKPAKPSQSHGTESGETRPADSSDSDPKGGPALDAGADTSKKNPSVSYTTDGSSGDSTRSDAQTPRDAAADGSVDDGGLDASSDGGTNQDTRRNDAGTATCDASCACAAGFDCELVCGDQRCHASCESDARCDVSVGNAPEVTIDCAKGASCSAVDMTGEDTRVVCAGEGNCRAECGLQESCVVECKGQGRCVTTCHGDTMCNVTCKAGADCSVIYDTFEHVALVCEVGELNYCDGIVTCGLPCP